MSRTNYDLIIVGAGSVGLPTAYEAARAGLKVLVIDSAPSAGQGDNKKAIGGIRATHSDKGKILTAQRSIEVFANWQETHGDDIDWQSNGYSFPAYSDEMEKFLKDLMKVQHSYGLNIDWVGRDDYLKLNPGVAPEGLRGSTYSPEDGSASPMKFAAAIHRQARAAGAEFRFKERVTGLKTDRGRIIEVTTDKGGYGAGTVVNAAGAFAGEVAGLVGESMKMVPDSHEAAISEPVARFMGPMIVDLRHRPGSANFYFYQITGGQILFCLTPDPIIDGTDRRASSGFLPQVAARAAEIMPRLVNLRIRRSWRGMYHRTPDGSPIVGRSRETNNLIYASGMGGQGFMLGPGIGVLVNRLVNGELTAEDYDILDCFNPYRDYSGEEAFK